MNLLAGKLTYERWYNRIYTANIDERLRIWLDYILNKKGDQLACMETISRYLFITSSKNLLLEKNIEEHRKNCYVGGKLKILGFNDKVENSKLFGQVSQMFEIFMSNNLDFIKFLSNNIDYIMPDDYDEKKGKYRWLKNDYSSYFLLRTVLLTLKRDFEEVKKRCNAYLEKTFKDSYNKYGELHYEFLLALVDKNVTLMKETVNKMMDKKVARKFSYDCNPNYEFYLHVYVIIYCKIALYHGIDLEIDNEVAPKELIDITPLEKYEDPYDFMKDFDLATITTEEWKKWQKSWNLNLSN